MWLEMERVYPDEIRGNKPIMEGLRGLFRRCGYHLLATVHWLKPAIKTVWSVLVGLCRVLWTALAMWACGSNAE